MPTRDLPADPQVAADPHLAVDPGLLARVELAYARQARCLDEDDLESWPGFFVADCEYKVTTAANHRAGRPIGMIYADSRDMLVDRVRSLRTANIYERHAYRHLLGRTLVLSADAPGVLETETPFMVARIALDGETMLFATGRYLDRVVADGPAVRLARRTVVCDSPRIDTLLAIPL